MAQSQQDISTIFQSFLQIQLDTFKNAVNSVNSIQLQWQQNMTSFMFFNNLFEQAKLFGFSDEEIYRKLSFIARINSKFCNLKYVFHFQLHELLAVANKYAPYFPKCILYLVKKALVNVIGKQVTLTQEMTNNNVDLINNILQQSVTSLNSTFALSQRQGKINEAPDYAKNQLRKIQTHLQRNIFDFLFFPHDTPIQLWTRQLNKQLPHNATPPFINKFQQLPNNFSLNYYPQYLVHTIRGIVQQSIQGNQILIRTTNEYIKDTLEQVIQLNQQYFHEVYQRILNAVCIQIQGNIKSIIREQYELPQMKTSGIELPQQEEIVNIMQKMTEKDKEFMELFKLQNDQQVQLRSKYLNVPQADKINIFASFNNFYSPKLFSKTQTQLTSINYSEMQMLMEKIQIYCRQYVIKDDTTTLNYKDSDTSAFFFFIDTLTNDQLKIKAHKSLNPDKIDIQENTYTLDINDVENEAKQYVQDQNDYLSQEQKATYQKYGSRDTEDEVTQMFADAEMIKYLIDISGKQSLDGKLYESFDKNFFTQRKQVDIDEFFDMIDLPFTQENMFFFIAITSMYFDLKVVFKKNVDYAKREGITQSMKQAITQNNLQGGGIKNKKKKKKKIETSEDQQIRKIEPFRVDLFTGKQSEKLYVFGEQQASVQSLLMQEQYQGNMNIREIIQNLGSVVGGEQGVQGVPGLIFRIYKNVYGGLLSSLNKMIYSGNVIGNDEKDVYQRMRTYTRDNQDQIMMKLRNIENEQILQRVVVSSNLDMVLDDYKKMEQYINNPQQTNNPTENALLIKKLLTQMQEDLLPSIESAKINNNYLLMDWFDHVSRIDSVAYQKTQQTRQNKQWSQPSQQIQESQEDIKQKEQFEKEIQQKEEAIQKLQTCLELKGGGPNDNDRLELPRVKKGGQVPKYIIYQRLEFVMDSPEIMENAMQVFEVCEREYMEVQTKISPLFIFLSMIEVFQQTLKTQTEKHKDNIMSEPEKYINILKGAEFIEHAQQQFEKLQNFDIYESFTNEMSDFAKNNINIREKKYFGQLKQVSYEIKNNINLIERLDKMINELRERMSNIKGFVTRNIKSFKVAQFLYRKYILLKEKIIQIEDIMKNEIDYDDLFGIEKVQNKVLYDEKIQSFLQQKKSLLQNELKHIIVQLVNDNYDSIIIDQTQIMIKYANECQIISQQLQTKLKHIFDIFDTEKISWQTVQNTIFKYLDRVLKTIPHKLDQQYLGNINTQIIPNIRTKTPQLWALIGDKNRGKDKQNKQEINEQTIHQELVQLFNKILEKFKDFFSNKLFDAYITSIKIRDSKSLFIQLEDLGTKIAKSLKGNDITIRRIYAKYQDVCTKHKGTPIITRTKFKEEMLGDNYQDNQKNQEHFSIIYSTKIQEIQNEIDNDIILKDIITNSLQQQIFNEVINIFIEIQQYYKLQLDSIRQQEQETKQKYQQQIQQNIENIEKAEQEEEEVEEEKAQAEKASQDRQDMGENNTFTQNYLSHEQSVKIRIEIFDVITMRLIRSFQKDFSSKTYITNLRKLIDLYNEFCVHIQECGIRITQEVIYTFFKFIKDEYQNIKRFMNMVPINPEQNDEEKSGSDNDSDSDDDSNYVVRKGGSKYQSEINKDDKQIFDYISIQKFSYFDQVQSFDYFFAKSNENVMGFFKFLFQNSETAIEYDAKKKSPINDNAKTHTLESLNRFMETQIVQVSEHLNDKSTERKEAVSEIAELWDYLKTNDLSGIPLAFRSLQVYFLTILYAQSNHFRLTETLLNNNLKVGQEFDEFINTLQILGYYAFKKVRQSDIIHTQMLNSIIDVDQYNLQRILIHLKETLTNPN